MTILTQGPLAAAHLLFDIPEYSRDIITVASGAGALKAGRVLGKITLGAATAAAVAGNTGNGTIGAVTLSAGAMAGVYKITLIEPATNAGTFVVEDPLGVTIGRGNVGSAYSAGGLAFTLSDGATDFVAGDQFTITVAAGSGKYVPLAPSAADGSQVAAGVLFDDADATSADKSAVANTRLTSVAAASLTWGAESAPQKAVALTQLAASGIISR